MTTWTKIEKHSGGNLTGKRARDTFAVSKSASGNPTLIIPACSPHASKPNADILSDGNGRIGFQFGFSGDFKVGKIGPASKARRVAIPRTYSDRIPQGTTDVTVTDEDGMLVLDLSQLS